MSAKLTLSSGPTAMPLALRLIIGVVLLTLGLTAIVASALSWPGVDLPLQLAVPLGGVFALVGAYLLLGRRGVILDKEADVVRTWWGLLVPISSKPRGQLSECTTVTITKELRASGRSSHGGGRQRVSYTVYPVRLKRRQGKPAVVTESRNYLASRRVAEAVSNFLGLNISDRTGGVTTVRQAGTLDEPLVQRLRAADQPIEVPTQPTDSRITQEGPNFVIPAEGWGLMAFLPLTFGLVLLAAGIIWGAIVVLTGSADDVFGYLMPGLLLIPGVALAVKGIKEATTSQSVSVSADGLAVGLSRAAEFHQTTTQPGRFGGVNPGAHRQPASAQPRADRPQ